jgi:hypothetical protein
MAWWKKLLLGTCAFVLWAAGLGVAGSTGYPSQYFWCSAALIAIACAVAPFWRRRNAVWYWPSVGFLIIANVAAMYLERGYVAQTDLPSKGLVQLLVVIDCIACWLLMVGCACLVDGRFPWKADESR